MAVIAASITKSHCRTSFNFFPGSGPATSPPSRWAERSWLTTDQPPLELPGMPRSDALWEMVAPAALPGMPHTHSSLGILRARGSCPRGGCRPPSDATRLSCSRFPSVPYRTGDHMRRKAVERAASCPRGSWRAGCSPIASPTKRAWAAHRASTTGRSCISVAAFTITATSRMGAPPVPPPAQSHNHSSCHRFHRRDHPRLSFRREWKQHAGCLPPVHGTSLSRAAIAPQQAYHGLKVHKAWAIGVRGRRHLSMAVFHVIRV
jgi:hypothetical protein